jgi:hypothetical protein
MEKTKVDLYKCQRLRIGKKYLLCFLQLLAFICTVEAAEWKDCRFEVCCDN